MFAVHQADIGQMFEERAMTTHHNRYTRENLVPAVAASTNMREVLDFLGVPRTGGSHAHITRRIHSFGIDVSHFTTHRADPEPFPPLVAPELASALAQSRSMADLARRLGLPPTVRTRRHLARQLADHSLDTTRLGHQRLVLDRAALCRAAAECISLVGVIHALGLAQSNSNIRRVRRALDVYGIDTTHFVRRSWRDPDPRPSRRTEPSRILCRRAPGSTRVGGERLRRALLATGVPEQCRECGLGTLWRGRGLTLEVDHVNGDWLDNRAENLRLLCPNCHATTDTYCRKKASSR
jgi:hypothetical protein